ncbi:hypothetical protein IB275_30340 [Pseudomonas sp. PDM21]|uniref:primase-helicase family protein n=1 Tax=Pseudomonas sp. PDM21 TaxID=2769257 RepID=UPI0017861068|nr:primase-helicase family protein [Pseudomonas sp. PDM21]MBD9674915.1 hypothetical protein [Pseudomonas sp. PDM21]
MRRYQIAVCESRENPNLTHKNVSWQTLAEKMATPKRTAESIEAYLSMTKDEQLAIKDVGGLVAGHFKGFLRRKANMVARSLLTLDIDEPGCELDQLLRTLRGELFGLAYLIHSTHKHTPEAPRVRVVIPTKRNMSLIEHEAVARRLAYQLDPSMHMVDLCSFEGPRLMFWPSASKDGAWLFLEGQGDELDVDRILDSYADPRDPAQWPRRQNEDAHVPAATREDPRTKRGVIGAFCRVYDIERAMAELIPGVYEAEQTEGRYHLVGGTTAGGARIYCTADGWPAFLHSEHDHDPARGQHNAWDLIRIHQGLDEAGMMAWAGELPEVKAELDRQVDEEFDEVAEGEGPEDGQPGRFAWLAPWVYVSCEAKFFNTDTRDELLTREGFDGSFARNACKVAGRNKRGVAELSASEIALHQRPVDVVSGVRYQPGAGAMFRQDGKTWANSYLDGGPAAQYVEDSQAVQGIHALLANLFTEERDRELLLDYMAHIIRKPGERLQYAMLVRGAEGDGKTLFASMLAGMMGVRNFTTVNNDQLKEKYNGYVEGKLLVAVEEVKQHGMDAEDVLNRLKPIITNELIGVRAMRQDVRTVRNFAALYMTTNFGDALPLALSDSRICVLSTRFQTKAEVDAWRDAYKAEHGRDFYGHLWRSVVKSDQALAELRGYLERRPFSQWYDDERRAPETLAKLDMIGAGRSEADTFLDDCLADEALPTVTREFLVWGDLADYASRKGEPLAQNLRGRAIAKFMMRRGFVRAVRVAWGQNQTRVWIASPEWFKRDGVSLKSECEELVRKALRKAERMRSD